MNKQYSSHQTEKNILPTSPQGGTERGLGLLVFGGTTEGRLAVRVLEEAGKPFYYSTKGSGQVVTMHHGRRLCGAMTHDDMCEFCKNKGVKLIVDAAHPFAENLHATIAEVAKDMQLKVVRLQRPEVKRHEEVVYCRDFNDALQRLEALQPKRLLALTGSNTIEKLRHWWESHDTILRMGEGNAALTRPITLDCKQEKDNATCNLSPLEGNTTCNFSPIEGNATLAADGAQGHLRIITTPLSVGEKTIFDYDEERMMMQQLHCDAMITKQSGGNGAEDTKVRAALSLGMKVLVVERPKLSDDFIVVTGEHGLRRAVEQNLPGFFPLRTGFTTGACATAAAKAALLCLLTGEEQHEVFFTLPNGEVMQMEVESTEVEYSDDDDADTKTIKAVECAVRKDAGDDPDVTNGAIIRVRVRPSGPIAPLNPPNGGETGSYNCTSNVQFQDFSQQDSSDFSQQTTPQQNIGNLQFTPEGGTKGCLGCCPLTFLGGPGVGTVTLPGLGIPVGEPAINPTPRRMIEQEFASILSSCNLISPQLGGLRGAGVASAFSILISVDGGEELAKRTFNSRVGVVGGISIIGTSGIVRPFSNEAFIESICREIEVAKAVACDCLVINSGAKSERHLKALLDQHNNGQNKNPDQRNNGHNNNPDQRNDGQNNNLDRRNDSPTYRYVHYGNAIGETLKAASDAGIPRIIMGIMLGKAVKLAEGHLDTHSHLVTMNRDFLATMLRECGADSATTDRTASITLARELWTMLPETLLQPFADTVKRHCQQVCRNIIAPSTSLEIVLIDEQGKTW